MYIKGIADANKLLMVYYRRTTELVKAGATLEEATMHFVNLVDKTIEEEQTRRKQKRDNKCL